MIIGDHKDYVFLTSLGHNVHCSVSSRSLSCSAMLGETPRHTTAHTLLLLQQLDCLQLFDDVRKCIRNDCDHDEEGEDEDQDCRHDRLDVLQWEAGDR